MSSSIEKIEELRRLAKDAYDNDQMASAAELLQYYLEFFPTDSKALFNYGDALRVLGRKGEAAVALAAAERSCPPEHAWTVQGRLGLLFHDSGDLVTAERWYSRALQSEEAQQCSWLWILRGANLALQELLSEAEECHRRAISANKKDDEAYLNLAMVLRAKGAYPAAVAAAQEALNYCPDYPEAEEVIRCLEGAVAARDLISELKSTSS